MVPVLDCSAADCGQRISALRQFFLDQFGSEPTFFVRVPGRVNIIGEHVDYCGYPVLPMAISQSILLAVQLSTDVVLDLRNVDAQFEGFKCDLNSLSINLTPGASPKWYNYYLCGVKGIFEAIGGEFTKIGMRVAVSGNIPHSAGLSSSSALVSSAALATAHAHNFSLDKKRLASIAANCERYIGTQGGGMDQAIAFLAEKGCAQFIEFKPELKSVSVKLPPNVCFVVANSLTNVNKAATSDYNERVVECRIGCLILAKRMAFVDWSDWRNLADLQIAASKSLLEMEEMVLQTFAMEEYGREDVLKLLEVSDEEFKESVLTPNTQNMTTFKLRQRVLHVVQESLRVQEFRRTCQEGTPDVEQLSALMQKSHESLRELYECSHPKLDQLVDISDACNVGARLTGAGWGGCVVALCRSIAESQEYIQRLKDEFYGENSDIDQLVFATWPENGAEIFLSRF